MTGDSGRHSMDESSQAAFSQSAPQYRLSPWRGEFLDPATEVAFREYIRPIWVRDTRRAFIMAALFYLAFAITDFLLLGLSEQYQVVFLTRLLVTAAGLAIAFTAERYWRLLVDGITPTLVVGLALTGFLSITLLRPLDVGWHGMSMMIMLLGTYVFIPNRFLPVLLLASVSTVAFLSLLVAHFELGYKEVMVMSLLFFAMNVFGASTAHRVSRLNRENFRDAQILRQANARLSQEVAAREGLEQDLISRVHHDELTGAMSRRRFQDLADRRLQEHAASRQPLSLLLLEADYLKQIKDTYGHVRADEVLRALVGLFQGQMGEREQLGRLGEETFTLLAPGMDLMAARSLAEQVRAQVSRTPIALADSAIHITVSIGVAQWRPGEALAELLRRADQALQGARYAGRNRVQVWTAGLTGPGSTIPSN